MLLQENVAGRGSGIAKGRPGQALRATPRGIAVNMLLQDLAIS